MTESPAARAPKDSSWRMGLLALWAGLLLPPCAWVLGLLISYILVPWTCATGRQFALHWVTLAMVLLAGVGGFMAWRMWKRVSRDRPEESGVSCYVAASWRSGGC
jgi:hypothetical protein